MNSQRFDVVIVGGGIVGGALACALAQGDLHVALIEARQLDKQWPPARAGVDGYDLRVSALTPASRRFLESAGAWTAAVAQRVSPYCHMHVWDAEGTGHISFDAGDVNQPELGHIVENRVTARALLRQMQVAPNVTLVAPARVLALHHSAGAAKVVRVTTEDGREFEAPLVVAADGANSPIRSLLDIPVREWDYGHRAIVATVECERSHQLTAWQRFLPEGPLAFLPLTSDDSERYFCSIVWSTAPAQAERLQALSTAAFCEQLGAAFEFRLGRILASSERVDFPLRQRHAIDYVRSGVALVGDAAHAIHPLAGQGVNLGLLDAQVLAEEVMRARRRAISIADPLVLQRYQRRRKSENLLMMAGMEGFKRLFEQDRLPLRWARNVGMRWLDQRVPLKRKIIRQAMGL